MKTNPPRFLLVFTLPFLNVTVLKAAPVTGPLRVHPSNPRYFTDGTKMSNGSLRAVYLTGSHHWNNLQDSAKPGKPLTEKFDYDDYLRFLKKFNNKATHCFTPPAKGDWVLLLWRSE